MFEELRDKIDHIDDELVRLITERLSIAGSIAEIKKAEGLPILNSAREREIISRLTMRQPDALAGYIKILFTTMFDLSRSHQARLVNTASDTASNIRRALEETPSLFPKSAIVACQGMEGANSTAACEKLFERPNIMYFNTFDGVFSAVEKGLCRYGVLPIENSIHGSVNSVYELMNRYRFFIVQGAKLKINHVLMSKPGVRLNEVKKIYSHEQTLAQCSDFLETMKVPAEAYENNASAAKLVSGLDPCDAAAIAPISCAELYNLEVLNESVQNSDNNYTKFICISRKLEIYPGARKISLMMTLPHKPGSLYQLMAKYAALGINLTKLESRPLPDKDFEFMFYFDLDVSVYDEAVFNLFSQLEGSNERFVFLGCYTEI